MKKLLATTAIVAAFAGGALAQTATTTITTGSTAGFVNSAMPDDIRGSDLMNAEVYAADYDGDAQTYARGPDAALESIGAVEDVLISRSGEVRAVLVDVGGFLGMGAKRVAVDMNQLNFVTESDDADEWRVVVDMSREMLESAPEFQDEDATAMRTGTAMTGTGVATGGAGMDGVGSGAATGGTAMTGTGATGTTSGGAGMTGGTAGLAVGPTITREGWTSAEPTALTAENLTGVSVYDANDEDIGSIQDFVLSADGRIEAAVIDVGGFLGMGAHRVALPFSEMSILRQDGGEDFRAYVDATEDRLREMPAFDG